MRRVHLIVLMAVLMAAVTAPAAAQDEGDWNFSVDTTFVNQYLWRGFVLNNTPSLQPNISLGYKGFSISSWSNFAHTGPAGQNWTEHDMTLDYSHSFDKLGVNVGYIWYEFPDVPAGDAKRTHEVYAGVSYDTLFSPSFTFYRDVDDGDGNYMYLSGGHSKELGKGVVLNGGLGLGINNKQWIDITTVSNFDIKVSVDIPAGHVVFSPFYQHSIGHNTLFGDHNIFGVNMTVASFNF